MRILTISLALAAAFGLCVQTGAFAEEAPAAKAAPAKAAPAKAAPAKAAPAETATVATKTDSPVCSMMGWVMKQISGTEGCKEGCMSSALTTWMDGGADVPLAGMRDQLKADGWTATSTIAFFKKMKAERAAKGEGCCGEKSGECSDKACDGAAKECCEGEKECCDKADAPSECTGCPEAAKKKAEKAPQSPETPPAGN